MNGPRTDGSQTDGPQTHGGTQLRTRAQWQHSLTQCRGDKRSNRQMVQASPQRQTIELTRLNMRTVGYILDPGQSVSYTMANESVTLTCWTLSSWPHAPCTIVLRLRTKSLCKLGAYGSGASVCKIRLLIYCHFMKESSVSLEGLGF